MIYVIAIFTCIIILADDRIQLQFINFRIESRKQRKMYIRGKVCTLPPSPNCKNSVSNAWNISCIRITLCNVACKQRTYVNEGEDGTQRYD